jgi:hypothetical protein
MPSAAALLRRTRREARPTLAPISYIAWSLKLIATGVALPIC